MKPKKSLGQNFLTSEAAVFKIVQAAKLLTNPKTHSQDRNPEIVLEIGPGKGVLTKALLATGANVIAVEKDCLLIQPLNEKFTAEIAAGKLKIIEADGLEIEPDRLDQLGLKSGEYKIVANLPYYITGQFFRKFLAGSNQPSGMVLLLQKEVVERIIAADKKESLLSISIKVYGQPKKITVVNRGSFFPAPNVDSAVIAIENISKKFFADISEDTFFEVLRAGFAHKRKILISNLVDAEIAPREKIAGVFTNLKIEPKIRAEDVSLEQWGMLAKKLRI